MSQRLARMLLLLLAFASTASGAFTTALDPVIEEVLERRAAITPPVPAELRVYRALGRVAREFAAASGSLADDLAVAERAARRIDDEFRRDPDLPRLMATAVDELLSAAQAERTRLALWIGRLDDPAGEPRLARGLDAALLHLDRAAANVRVASRARIARRGCLRLERARADLGLVGDPPPPEPVPPMPVFAISDVNPASPTSGALVSPRDYVDKISAWYFGRAG